VTTDKAKRDIEEDVEIGEEVENTGRPSATSLVAVRVPLDLLARMNDYAQAHAVTVSDVLRTGAEQLVSGTIRLDAYYVTGGTIYGSHIQPAPAALGAPAWVEEHRREPIAAQATTY
jgi:hypothetical protein